MGHEDRRLRLGALTTLLCGALGSGSMLGCGPGEATDGDEIDSEGDTTAGDPATPPDPTTGADGTAGPATGSGGQDTGPATDDGPGQTDGPDPGTTTGDPSACAPTPSRMVVLGDSIVACAGVGGTNSDDCAPRQLNDWYADTIGPITYENLSVGGAVTRNVAESQLGAIEVGIPGHTVVVIYIGGNDLAQYIFLPDQAALDGWNNTTGPEVAAAWETILDFLGDPANFPDGVTLLMNTQYNPFDDCTAPPYFVSQTKIELLHAHNDALVERANSRQWAFITDQHPSYLGHGHYVADSSCPYYDPTFEGWMNDLIHPNPAGHQHLAEQMVAVAQTEIYGGCD